jgi:predicted GNAT superfamily acetyltransferase
MTSRNPLPDFSLLWFVTRFEDFLFLERLVVEPGVRRAGIASALLERVLQDCREAGLSSVCCQVHDRPANREAQAFVLARGFRAIESVMLPSRDIVTMYQRSTATATP